jgi:hypothetical protein
VCGVVWCGVVWCVCGERLQEKDNSECVWATQQASYRTNGLLRVATAIAPLIEAVVMCHYVVIAHEHGGLRVLPASDAVECESVTARHK